MKKVNLKLAITAFIAVCAVAFEGCGKSESPFGYLDRHKITDFKVEADTAGVSVRIEAKKLVKDVLGESPYKAVILVKDTAFSSDFVTSEKNALEFRYLKTRTIPDSIAVISTGSNRIYVFDGKTCKLIRVNSNN